MDLILVLLFLVVFLISYVFISRDKLPPGPLTLPFIGSYFYLKQMQHNLPHAVHLEAAKKYGKVLSFRIGHQLFVVLTGYEAVHQALVKQADQFSDRPNFMPVMQEAYKEGKGVLLQTYNHQWKSMRRFTLQTLRDFGVGKSSLEDKIMTEVDAATQYLRDTNTEPTEMTPVLQMAIGNVIYGIVFGKRYSYDDPDFKFVRTLTEIGTSGQGLGNATMFFPRWLTKLIAKQDEAELKRRKDNAMKVNEFISSMIDEHRESYDENNIRDFVDLYIQVSQQDEDDTRDVFTIGNMKRVILDLFYAGSETTSTTLDWAFLYMAEYPEIQRRCKLEIHEALGDKPVQYSDRSKLTFVEATIMEIQRLASIVPLSVPHATLVDTTLMGYAIPRKTFVLPSLYSVSLDPALWEEPKEFKPDRFIDSKGKLLKKEAFIPFSIGPRTCLGEPLAKMELFLVFTNLLQRFTFERECLGVRHSFKPRPNRITSSPLPYRVRVSVQGCAQRSADNLET